MNLIGKVIKHEKFMDVAIFVNSVGQLEYKATELHITGMWMNQGFTRSWFIGKPATLTIKLEDLGKWLVCTDEHVDPCLRKCPWAKLGT